MNRRNALLAATGAMTTTLLLVPRRPAFAQASAMQIGEIEYTKLTLEAGTFSKQTSVLAMTMATNPRVREFAQFETNEQTAIAQVLTDEANPPAVPLNPKHAAVLASLRTQAGAAFDAAYIEGQISGHEELLNIQQGYLNGPPHDRNIEHIAVLARMTIQMHLTMLQDLRTSLHA
jgi:putative membrane protein